MMKLVMEVSLRDAGRCQDAICDDWSLNARMMQQYSDVWESEEYESEDDAESLECELEDQMLRFGVSEYEIKRIEL